MNQEAKFASFAFLLLNVCSRLGAQATAPPPRGKTVTTPPAVATFKVDVDLVLVEVGVHDEHGHAGIRLWVLVSRPVE